MSNVKAFLFRAACAVGGQDLYYFLKPSPCGGSATYMSGKMNSQIRIFTQSTSKSNGKRILPSTIAPILAADLFQTLPPEQRFASQLEQLSAMGFMNREANIQGNFNSHTICTTSYQFIDFGQPCVTDVTIKQSVPTSGLSGEQAAGRTCFMNAITGHCVKKSSVCSSRRTLTRDEFNR